MTTATGTELLQIGSPAPDFSGVLATGNRQISLGDYKGKFVILVFYPKDQTPGCTQQLCALRDDYSSLQTLKTDVLGVNPDGLESHEKFVEKQSYPFPILVDEGAKITAAYKAQKPEGGVQRTVYIVGPEGTVVFAQQGMPSDETLMQAIRSAS